MVSYFSNNLLFFSHSRINRFGDPNNIIRQLYRSMARLQVGNPAFSTASSPKSSMAIQADSESIGKVMFHCNEQLGP